MDTISSDGSTKPLQIEDAAAAGSKLAQLQARVNQLESDLLKSERARAGLTSTQPGNLVNSASVLHDRLEQSLVRGRRNKTKTSVMIIEFSTCREVKAAFGISYSERLIETVKQRLNSNLRDTDTVSLVDQDESDLLLARSGEDTFVLILEDLQDDDALVRIVDRIEKSLSRVFEIDGHEFYVTPCFGIAMGPVDGNDAISLMISANTALDHARKNKADGSLYRFYASEMDNFAREVLSLEAELHRAVERKEFILHYQPRIDCTSGDINGFEALVRWAHPARGLLMPDSFITLAEKTGLIEHIGEWVIETACRQLSRWSLLGFTELGIAINVSPIQMKRPRVLEVLTEQIALAQLDPKRIEIELTESVILSDFDKVVPLMRDIESAGIRIALDDFGTGYSSLGYLHKLPLHRLKIDRSFLSDLGPTTADYAIVNSVIEMAHALEMKVVVEGVEEPHQWEILKELGCDELQGYLLSRPIDVQNATEMLLGKDGSKLRLLHGSLNKTTGQANSIAIPGVLNAASSNEAFPVLRDGTTG